MTRNAYIEKKLKLTRDEQTPKPIYIGIQRIGSHNPCHFLDTPTDTRVSKAGHTWKYFVRTKVLRARTSIVETPHGMSRQTETNTAIERVRFDFFIDRQTRATIVEVALFD